jgi:hypothetical protein
VRAVIDDPVVAVAMKAVTERVGFGGNRDITLADYRDHATLIQALRFLHRGGHELRSAEIVPWAQEHGWKPPALKILERALRLFEQGRLPRGPRNPGQRWRADALEQWREAAGWTPPPSRRSVDW